MSKRWVVIAAFAMLALGGCYEGWEYGTGSGVPTPSEPPATPPVARPLHYILFEPFYLSDAAVADPTCFPTQGIATYRKAEWALRLNDLESALKGVADTVVRVNHPISVADCAALSAISSAAVAILPWGDQPPSVDPQDRVLVHVKAMMWQGDVALDPPSVVTNSEWVAFKALRSGGRRVLNAHHFVLSNAESGYFSTWRSRISEFLRSDGVAIDSVDPTASGIEQRAATSAADAKAFATWLVDRAGDVQ